MNRNIVILLVVLAAGIGAFFIFRKKKTVPVRRPSGNSFNRAPSRTVAAPTLPYRPPVATAAPPPPPSGFSVRQGVELAATAGCVAYSGGSLAPLCGVAAPLAVNFASKGVSALGSSAKKVFGGLF